MNLSYQTINDIIDHWFLSICPWNIILEVKFKANRVSNNSFWRVSKDNGHCFTGLNTDVFSNPILIQACKMCSNQILLSCVSNLLRKVQFVYMNTTGFLKQIYCKYVLNMKWFILYLNRKTDNVTLNISDMFFLFKYEICLFIIKIRNLSSVIVLRTNLRL